jgi:hypothetical protein
MISGSGSSEAIELVPDDLEIPRYLHGYDSVLFDRVVVVVIVVAYLEVALWDSYHSQRQSYRRIVWTQRGVGWVVVSMENVIVNVVALVPSAMDYRVHRVVLFQMVVHLYNFGVAPHHLDDRPYLACRQLQWYHHNRFHYLYHCKRPFLLVPMITVPCDDTTVFLVPMNMRKMVRLHVPIMFP